jgi:two-component system, sensor histidine kinase LadS
MIMMKSRLIILFSIFHLHLGLMTTKADELRTLTMNNEKEIYLIGSYAQILEDPTNSLSISDVSNTNFKNKFTNIHVDYPNLGVSSSTFWIRFRLMSHSDFRAFLFNIGYLFHDKLEMYRIYHGNPEQIFFSDIRMGEISHDHNQRNRFAVPMNLKADESSEYYLAIKDHEGVSLFLELSSEENFLRKQANDNLRFGVIAGLFILSSIFSIFVFFRDKRSPFLLFFCLNIFYVLNMLCHNGNLQVLLWPGNLKLNNDFYIFSGFITNAFSLLFTIYFLELKKNLHQWYIIGLFLTAFTFMGALSPVFGYDNFIGLFYYIQILGAIFELAIASYCAYRGDKLAKQFLASRFLFSSLILSSALLKLGWIPYPGTTIVILGNIALCLQVSLLAFIITDLKYKVEISKLAEEKDSAKLRNEELFNANKVKMEFIGMASHDLKGPLRNISALASFIENKQVITENEINQMASMIRQSSEKLANLVKDLLDNTALEMGKLELKLEDRDILKTIHSITEQYELEAKIKKQTIEVIANIEYRLFAAIDEIRFTQVIENLLSNAIKFSPFDKKIWIIVSKPENASVRIEIKDEGPGFTEEDKQFLFNYYKKLSAKPTGKESSSGLGLSIVKKIVQLHNGKIWLESEHGKGASFFVEI